MTAKQRYERENPVTWAGGAVLIALLMVAMAFAVHALGATSYKHVHTCWSSHWSPHHTVYYHHHPKMCKGFHDHGGVGETGVRG